MTSETTRLEQVFLVACAARKKAQSSPASELYTSELFKQSKTLASKAGKRWFILSAKHGLLNSEQIIEPYEQTLNQMSVSARNEWGNRVIEALKREIRSPVEIVLLAGKKYIEPIEFVIQSLGHSVWKPLAHLSIGRQVQWLQRANADLCRWRDVRTLYIELARLSVSKDQFQPIEKMAGSTVPQRGIYFFFDPSEKTTFTATVPRLVRIGTHAVSAGSKSTLWQRLRTHRGGNDLTGNHRGSIFRLHVGAAKLSSGASECDSWSKGQSATADIRQLEVNLEREVSEYIGKLKVAYLNVSDVVGPDSDRAYIEQNAVGLMSTPFPLDPISPSWLGLKSHRKAISESGLWNVNYIREGYDPYFIDVVREYVNRTLASTANTEISLAPPGWRTAKKKIVSTQLQLEI